MSIVATVILLSLAGIVLLLLHVIRIQRRARFINEYSFPERLEQKLRLHYPHLTRAEVKEVIQGLRDYFQVCRIAGRRMVAMPSQAVDLAWHEFILFTRNYQIFCKKSFGRFLHHMPAEAMASPEQAQVGIKTAWRLACRLEKIQPRRATRLPRLFALDSSLAIPDGFHYRLNCKLRQAESAHKGSIYCANSIGCSSCSSCSSDGSGCSSSDGGSSCGGGCGGD